MSKQRNELPNWLPYAATITIAFIIICLVARSSGLMPSFKSFVENSGPAWIQAVGSILAIIAASSIAASQARSAQALENEKRLRDEIKKLEVVMALMARAVGLTQDIITAFKSSKFEDFEQITPDLMDDTAATLKMLPLFEIPDALLSLDVMMVGRALESLSSYTDSFREACIEQETLTPKFSTQYLALASETLEVSTDALNNCKRRIKESKEELAAAHH